MGKNKEVFESICMVMLLSTSVSRKHKEKRQPSYTIGGNVSWCSHYGKQYGGSSEK